MLQTHPKTIYSRFTKTGTGSSFFCSLNLVCFDNSPHTIISSKDAGWRGELSKERVLGKLGEEKKNYNRLESCQPQATRLLDGPKFWLKPLLSGKRRMSAEFKIYRQTDIFLRSRLHQLRRPGLEGFAGAVVLIIGRYVQERRRQSGTIMHTNTISHPPRLWLCAAARVLVHRHTRCRTGRIPDGKYLIKGHLLEHLGV